MLAEPIAPQVHYDPRSSKRDKYLFAVVFLGGGGAIVVSKLLRLPTGVAVLAAVASLLTYSVLVTRVERFRLREDRAGDNAYYLGFLFTLTSLSYALWAFQTQGDGNVNDVIGNFALALVSTIIGLAIRVWFQQLRDDPVEFEHEARLSLAEAAVEVRRQLIGVTNDIGLLRQRVHDELSTNFVEKARDLQKAALESMKGVGEHHEKWLESTSTELREDRDAIKNLSTAMRTSLAGLAKALETQMQRIEKADIPSEVLRKRIDDILSAMDQVVSRESERAEKQKKAASEVLEVMNGLLTAVKDLEPKVKVAVAAGEATAASVKATSDSVKRLSESVDEAATSIRSVAATTVAEIKAMADKAKDLEQEVGKAASALSSSVAEMSGDVVKVKKSLVQSVETIRRELDGGRS